MSRHTLTRYYTWPGYSTTFHSARPLLSFTVLRRTHTHTHTHTQTAEPLTMVSNISRLRLSRILYQNLSMRDPVKQRGGAVNEGSGSHIVTDKEESPAMFPRTYPCQVTLPRTHKPSHFSRRNGQFCLHSLKKRKLRIP